MFPIELYADSRLCKKRSTTSTIGRRNGNVPNTHAHSQSTEADMDGEKLKARLKQEGAKKSLHALLDDFANEHAKDIYDFSGGHLNESKLYNPNTLHFTRESRWQTSRSILPPLSALAGEDSKSDARTHRESLMKSSLQYFSVDLPNQQPKPPSRRKLISRFRKSRVSFNAIRSEITLPSDWLDDGVHVEELQHPASVIHFVNGDLDRRDALKRRTPSQHLLLPDYLDGVTKRDQLSKMLQYDRNVLKRQDMHEQHVLTGVKAVEDLEIELQLALEMLHQKGYGPNFHRLQVYSNIFEKLISRSPTFGYILQEIKARYDDYVAALLDSPIGKHKVLSDQMEQISSGIGYNMKQLQEEMTRLAQMEAEGKAVLLINDRLRQSVREREEEMISEQSVPSKAAGASLTIESTVKKPSSVAIVNKDTKMVVSDKIELLHGAIWQRLHSVAHLRQTLNDDCVPISVCSQLQQCVKDTEAELQKLRTQEDYIEKTSAALKNQLINDVSDADTTEKDARRIWKKINAEDEEGDEEYNDEAKWSWYIS